MALHAKEARHTCFDYTVGEIFFTELIRKTTIEKKIIYRTGPQYGYGRESGILCMHVNVWLGLENMLSRQHTAARVQLHYSGHKQSSTWNFNIIIYCDAVVQSIFMKFAGVIGIDNPHTII